MNKKKKKLIILSIVIATIINTVIILLFILLFIFYYPKSWTNSYNNFCCKPFKGIIIKIDEDIKRYKEIELNNKEKHYLGLYLDIDLASEIQIGDSIFKDKNSMKIILYRNNEILGYSSNIYYSKNLKCECN